MATWKIDPDHSVATFSVRYLMVSNVHGMFCGIRGTIQFDPTDPGRSAVEATISAPGIYTGIKKRDDHLRSSDFFDVDRYPEITFRSTAVQGRDAGRLHLAGDLTLHGKTRQVVFEIVFAGPVKGPFGDESTLGFTARTKLNREDFGITWNEKMEGGLLIDREVHIVLDVQADLAEG